MISLSNLTPAKGARKSKKRVGCGEGSGHGKTSTKGHKGQKARSGGSIRLGFEGGQMPLLRKMPKRGFNNSLFHTTYAVVNVRDLGRFNAGANVDECALRELGIVRGRFAKVKLLASGTIENAITVIVDAVSLEARRKIESVGGGVVVRNASAS